MYLLKYLMYVLRHKWYVTIECFRIGLYWRGLIHDWDKFLPSMFMAYARNFYGPKEEVVTEFDPKTGKVKYGERVPPEVKLAFQLAWLGHQKRNRHHWEWWIMPNIPGKVKVLDMPLVYIKEMICDWVGAGKAQGFFSPKDDPLKETREWYKSQDFLFSDKTKEFVETILGILQISEK